VNASRAKEVFLREVLEVWLTIIGTEQMGMAWEEELDTEASVSRAPVVDFRMIVASTEDEQATEKDTAVGTLLAHQSSIRDRTFTSEMVTETGRTAPTDGAMLTLKETLITDEIESGTNREARVEAFLGLLRRIHRRRRILGAVVNLMDIQTEQRGFRRKSNRRKTVILKTIIVTMKTRKRMDGSTKRNTCQTAKIILTRTSNTLYLSRKETTNLQLNRQMKIQRQHRYTMSQILI